MRVALLALLPACGGGPDKPESDGGDTGPVPVCTAGTRWAPGTPAFRDATADWGLSGSGAVGVRISAVDFDGDGWTDLAVRRGTAGDDFSPGGERQTWLFRNTGEGRFEDVTQSTGIVAPRGGGDAGRPGPTWAFGDVDNDGDLDVYTGLPDAEGTSEETSEILLNDGAGRFTLGPEGSELRRGRGDMPFGASFTDIDLDGTLDLWVAQYDDTGGPQQDRLYVGDGAGGFTDIVRDSGVATTDWTTVDRLNEARSHTRAWAGLACDLDQDGLPELLSSSYGRSPNHLWWNRGGRTFENHSIASGYAFDERADWSDNESARCWCTLHPDDEGCDGVPSPELIACRTDDDAFRWDHDFDREPFRLGGNSGATLCADLDNDGWSDLLTTEIVHWDVGSSSDPSEILHNTGEVPPRFARPGNEVTGLTREYDRVDWNDGDITASAFDFDNDGWQDVYIGSTDYPGARGLLYHQDAALAFVGVPPAEGIDHFRSHGSAVADFDRDGDLDVVVGHSSARCDGDCRDTFEVRLFENLLGQDGNWVQVALVGGAGSNRAAIGARVELVAEGGGPTQLRQVDGGHGQWGQQDDLVQHFGLGTACAGTLRVTWPDAARTVEEFPVVAGHRFVLTQGGGATLAR